MKIEIWSDIVCPWCYIGKRRFEKALESFEHKEYIQVEYKSYQLDPYMETDTNISIEQYLADKKGFSLEHARNMSNQVTTVASSVGLEYNLEKATPINTLLAHELLHFAKSKNKQLELKERLLKAYFTEALNLDKTETLVHLAEEIGLVREEATQALVSHEYKNDVQKEIHEGVQLGLKGVPFYVFNRKYGVSGAQESGSFTQVLEKSFEDWRKDNPLEKLEIIDGKVCTPNGDCD